MALQEVQQQLSSIEIPCVLNRASLGTADYVFVVIHDLIEPKHKAAWVPRKDLIVDQQPLIGDQLSARLTVRVEREDPDGYVVTLVNDGRAEAISVPKNH